MARLQGCCVSFVAISVGGILIVSLAYAWDVVMEPWRLDAVVSAQPGQIEFSVHSIT